MHAYLSFNVRQLAVLLLQALPARRQGGCHHLERHTSLLQGLHMKASDAFLCANKLQQQVTHAALCLLWIYYNLTQAGILLKVCA